MPDFEVYDRRKSHDARRRVGASVSVLRRGLLSFSPDAMTVLGNPEAVTYLVDRGDKLLGFRAAKPGSKNASPVRVNGVTSAGPVLGYLGADLSESRRYPLVTVDGVPCIDLKEPGILVTSNRRKKEGGGR